MGRLKPTEVFPHSKGTKKFVFQDIIINRDKYFYISLDGQLKTNLYNKGVVDGTKKPLPLEEFDANFETNYPTEKWLLAIPKSSISPLMVNLEKHLFIGRIGVVKTFILKIDTIGTFLEYSCSLGECPYDGQQNCFKLNKFDCSLPNRQRHTKGRYSYA